MSVVRHPVLVSGASGVVGQPLVTRLRERGYAVWEVSRDVQPTSERWGLGWDLESGETPDLPSLAYFVHCAPIWLLPDNIGPLASAGVKRIIAFSSSSASSKAQSADGAERALAGRLRQGEAAARETCDSLGIQLTLFRPTLIYGFGRDQNIMRIARILKRYRLGLIAGSGTGLRQPVHALDLVDAVEKAMDNPESYNKTYELAGGETMTYREMMERIFHALGQEPRIISLPVGIFRLLMRCAALFADFRYTAAMADRMNMDLSYDSGAAVEDFAYSPTPFLEYPARDLPGLVAHSGDK